MNRTLRILVMAAATLMPARAWAHAHLVRSDPAAGSHLAVAPQVIRLWFSEQPELSMTFASLKDSAGKTFALSSAERETSGQMGLALHVLKALPPGRYILSWRTAASDGHPSSGKFAFVVLAGPTEASGVTLPPAASRVDITGAVLSPGTTVVPRKETPLDAEDLDAASSIGNSIARAYRLRSGSPPCARRVVRSHSVCSGVSNNSSVRWACRRESQVHFPHDCR